MLKGSHSVIDPSFVSMAVSSVSRWLLTLGLLCAVAAGSARAQEAAAAPDTSGQLVVSRVSFEGNDFFSDTELRGQVRTAPNRRFLGIPGLAWWRWVYQLGETGVLGERLSEGLRRSGEAPAYLDEEVLEADRERLRAFYRQEGFRAVEVATRVDTAGAERAAVIFEVEPGPATYIRRVRYEGVDTLDAERRSRIADESLLERRPDVAERDTLQFTAANQRYSEPLLHEERRRLLTLLRNEGFAAVTRDSIRALVFPVADSAEAETDSFDVTFRIRPGERYRFGDVQMRVSGPEEEAGARRDTMHFPAGEDQAGGTVAIRIEGESKLEPVLLERALRFRPGWWYDASSVQATKRRLEATGVFAFTDIIAEMPDTIRFDGQATPVQPHRIELRTRPRHQLQLETFMLQRSGVLGAADSELGTGVGVTYENANLLGGGEALRLRGSGSVAADTDLQFFTSAQAEVSASLVFPYLVAPFRWMDRTLSLYNGRTRFSLGLLSARRDALNLLIRGRGNARFRLEMQHTAALTSLVDLLDVSLSNPDTLSGFHGQFLNPILQALNDPVQQGRIIEDYTQPQVNNALRYTLRLANVNPLRRERGYSYEASVEAGGNLPYVLDRFTFTPDVVEGSLPGLPVFQDRSERSRLIYRRYVRVVGDLRRYLPLNSHTVLAWKAIGGLAHPLGQTRVVPFDRRFYSGGASSVRGWRLRELGPGRARFASAESLAGNRSGANLLGGDVKLETALELRYTLLEQLLGAQWIGVLFGDAGNVWFGPRNPGFGRSSLQSAIAPDITADSQFDWDDFFEEIGVSTGIGLRLSWKYVIARLDLAARVHDPARQGVLFPNGLDDPVLHFGIGHTF